MMNNLVKTALVLFFTITIYTCSNRYPKIGLPKTYIESSMGLKEEFHSFSTPRTSHPPGYIYRTSKKNNSHYQVLTVDAKIDSSEWAIPEIKSNSDFSRAFNLMGLGEINGQYSSRNEVSYTIEFEGCELEQITEVELLNSLKGLNLNFRSDEKYYVIVATISIKKVSITFDNSKYSELNGEIRPQIDSINLGVSTSRSANDEFIINRDFDSPHRFFYRYARIDSRGILSDLGSNAFISIGDVDGVIIN